jgi:hypothetical protein
MPRTHVSHVSSRGQATVALSMALTLSAVGIALLVVMLRDRPVPAEAVVGGVSLRVQEAGWIRQDHADHAAEGGFQMPSAMMPGAPQPGEERLRVQVVLTNRADSPKRLNDGAFRLENAGGDWWPLQAETIGLDQLAPGLAVSGSLQFDLPNGGGRLGDGSLRLVWERAGKVVRVALPAGAAPEHVEH